MGESGDDIIMKLLTTKERESFEAGTPIRVFSDSGVAKVIEQLKGLYPTLKWGHPEHDEEEPLDFHRFELGRNDEYPILLYTRDGKLMWDEDQVLDEVIERGKK